MKNIMKRVFNQVSFFSNHLINRIQHHKNGCVMCVGIAFLLLLLISGFLYFGNVFATGVELNSKNIESTYGCSINSTHCNLSNQGIVNIASDTFVNHTNLTSLDLSNNQITSIENRNFNGLYNLHELYLNNNFLTFLPEDIRNLSISKINLEQNCRNVASMSKELVDFLDKIIGSKYWQTDLHPECGKHPVADFFVDPYLCGSGVCESAGYCALAERDIDCSNFDEKSCPTKNACILETAQVESCEGKIDYFQIIKPEVCSLYNGIWTVSEDGKAFCQNPENPVSCTNYPLASCPTDYGCFTKKTTSCVGEFDETTITQEQCKNGEFMGTWTVENDNSCPIDCESDDALVVVEDVASFIPGVLEVNNLTISGVQKIDSVFTSNFTSPGLQGWKITYTTQTGIFGNDFKFISTNDGVPYLSLMDNGHIYIKTYQNGKRKTVSKSLTSDVASNGKNYSYSFGMLNGNIPYILTDNSLHSLNLPNGEWTSLIDHIEHIGNELGGQYIFTKDSLQKLSNGKLTELSLPNTSCEVMDVKGSTPGAEGIEIFAIYSCENGNKEFWSLTDNKVWIQIAKDRSYNGSSRLDRELVSNIVGGGINTYIKPNIVEIYFYNEKLGYEIYDYFYFVDNKKRTSLPGRPDIVLNKNNTLYFVIENIFYAYDGKGVVSQNKYNTFSPLHEKTDIHYLSDKNGDFYIQTINDKNMYPNQRANLFKFSNGKWNKIMDFTPLYNQYDSGEDNRLAILPVPGIYGIQLDENGLPLIGCFVFALNEESSGPHNIKADIYQWSDSTDSHFIKWLDMIGENTDIDSIVDTITDFIGGKEETTQISDFENQRETLYEEKNYLSQQINEIELGNLSSYILNDFKNNKELELNELEKSDSFTEAELSQLKIELIIIIDKIAFLKGEPISDLLLSELIKELNTDRENKEIEIKRIQEYAHLTNEQIEELKQLEIDREMINSKINQLASRKIPQEIIDEITNEIINEIINGLNNQINLIQGEIDTLNDEIQKLKDIVDDEQLDETELIEKVRSALNTILLSGNININIPLAPYVIHIDGNDGISTYNNYTQDEVVFDAKLNLDNGISADINSDLPFVISYQAGNIKIRKYTNKKWDVLIEETINAENDGIRSRFPVLFQNDAIIITHDKEKENISIKGYKNTNRSTLIDLGTELPSVDTLISMFEDSMEISNTIKDDNKEKKGGIIDYFPGFFTYNERLYGVINEFGLASFGNGIRHVSNTGLDLGDNILGSRMDSDGVEHIIKTTQTKTGTTLVTYSLEDTLKNIEFQYQWYSNDKTIDGANDLTYTSNSFDAGNELYLSVAVKNSRGVVGSPVKSNSLFIENNNIFEPTSTSNSDRGGGIRLRKDFCPKGDFSPSYYDGTCEKSSVVNNNKLPTHNSADLPAGNINNSSYSNELNKAYLRALKYDITTIPTIQKADIYGSVTRVAMAKMISNYSMNILDLEVNTDTKCSFPDVSNKLNTEYDNAITNACKLGLMGQKMENFRPNDIVTRAEFGTVISRMLRGDRYEGGSTYYEYHLKALKDADIMRKIENPSMEEIRGRVMIVLNRTFDQK